jgi:ribosomal protein L11 methyltransferase
MKIDNPYGDLHIYYLQGRVTNENCLIGDGYIGNWEEDGHSFLFFKDPSPQVIEALVIREPQLIFLDQFEMTYDEWHGGSVAPFTTGSISVIPPWWRPPEPEGKEQQGGIGPIEDTPLLLDPGVVFGTGFHPTTRDCIQALEMLAGMAGFDTLIDIGTGSGLLALAAVKLGGRRALAVDCNLLAVQTAQRNIRLNKMEDRVVAVQGEAENFIDFPRDLMISNIHYDVMNRLINNGGFLLNGYFILSGLLRSQAIRIERKLCDYPVEIIQKWDADSIWHTYLGRVK